MTPRSLCVALLFSCLATLGPTGAAAATAPNSLRGLKSSTASRNRAHNDHEAQARCAEAEKAGKKLPECEPDWFSKNPGITAAIVVPLGLIAWYVKSKMGDGGNNRTAPAGRS